MVKKKKLRADVFILIYIIPIQYSKVLLLIYIITRMCSYGFKISIKNTYDFP